MPYSRVLSIPAALLLAGSLTVSAGAAQPEGRRGPRPAPVDQQTVLRYEDGAAACDLATPLEAEALAAKDEAPLRVVYPGRAAKEGTGLSIVLRGTTQLDQYPEARDAFIAGARQWEALIRTPITIVINVDFGPKRFGQTYPARVLGSTSPQYLISDNDEFEALRTALVEQSASLEEEAAFTALAPGGIPTDLGPSSNFLMPSAIFRALGNIAPVADPENEGLGSAPSIGFNSAFSYDFDPTDGITSTQLDFDAIVTHEIGHALGFISDVGFRDFYDVPVSLSTWDLFRYRPGVTSATAAAAPRVLTAGGDQVYLAGNTTYELSTGRPDASGGDGRQASHWKDYYTNGRVFIGIMHPVIGQGLRLTISPADVHAIDYMGYAIAGGSAPAVTRLAAALQGDTLAIDGSGTDADGGRIKAKVEYLDQHGAVLFEGPVAALSTGGQTSFPFALSLAGLSAYPAATLARVTLYDNNYNESAGVTADFTAGDAGGPQIASADPAGKKLVLKGTGFTGDLQLEVNGAAVTPRKIKANKKGTKATLTGTAAELGLRPGANRVLVRAAGLRSNFVVVTVR